MLRFKGLGYFLFQVYWIQLKSVPFANIQSRASFARVVRVNTQIWKKKEK